MKKTSCSLKKLRASSIPFFGFAAASASLAAFAVHAQAQILVEDTFSAANGANGYLSARGADDFGCTTDTIPGPGGPTYQGLDQDNGYNTFESGDQGSVENGNGAVISLGVSVPTELSFTMNFTPFHYGGSGPILGGNPGYEFFGFYGTSSQSAYGQGRADVELAGLALDDAGNLYSDNNGTLSAPIAFGGTYTWASNSGTGPAETISFDLNTITGALTNVSLAGSTASYYFAPLGSASANYAGFGVNQTGQGTSATYFEVQGVSAVPEPSTYMTTASGILALGLFQYRRRQRRFGV